MFKFVDLHCDTITKAKEDNMHMFENGLQVNVKKLKEFKSPVQIFAIWLQEKYYENAFFETNKNIDFFERQLELNKKFIKKATNLEEIEKDDKIKAMLSLEGGESIENNIQNIEYFYKRGVRFFGFCWNYENNLGFGVGTDSKKGLKSFGKEVLKEINRLNIISDVSHINEAGFWDIYNFSNKPFIATHSNAYGICRNKRNLKDEQIKAIKERNGVIGLNLYPYFLKEGGNAYIDDVLRHIDYIMNLIGDNNICLGADFDGIDETTNGLEDISKLPNLFIEIEKNYGKNVLEKIAYKNFYSFVRENLK